MRVLLVLLLFFIFGGNSAFAYDLVLPKEKKSIVNSNYVFFVGKANKSEIISINDEKVYIAPNGAFAHSIKLKDGENRILVKSNFSTQVYKFYKDKTEKFVEPELIDLVPRIYLVKKDNTPLRSTPVDYGMNRISHLFEDTCLIINGQKGDFYRVLLSKNKEAWIAKSAVIASNKDIKPEFVSMDSDSYKNASKHKIQFTEKLPYTIEETDNEIFFRVYNPIVSENSIYTMNIKKPRKYKYETISFEGEYIFKVKELPISNNNLLEGLIITIDAGHGGNEKGAIGCLGDMEKDINLKIANELYEILSQNGANVIMTRECDGFISLEDRIKIAQKNGTDIFISIHLNSIPDIKMDIHKNKGTSVYYYNSNSKELAKYIEENVSDNINTRKDGVKSASFAVIRPTEYVGVLVEIAYMTNPIDSVIYTKEDFPSKAAKGIADGIMKFVQAE